uniref:Lipase domain-containing protein n=1 Tax=Glossina morsitans morsitans TaxID=37546 RepID=A0A1B0F9P3_GLOMM
MAGIGRTLHCMLITAVISFTLGAYYQHYDILRQLCYVINDDPYAFHIRDKLYGTLRFFKNNVGRLKANETYSCLPRIMKYGFPGMEDLRVYDDFVISYDRRNRVARWVYEHLQTSSIFNTAGSRRMAEYKADLGIPSDFRVDTTDYKDSGYDKGHLAASGNHKSKQSHCNDTFYLTNIAPQVGEGFNRGCWQKLEAYVRDLCKRYGSVFVCTGPLYLPRKSDTDKWYVEYEVFGPKTIAVPTHYFKVITVESKLPGGLPYMEAYVMPNKELDEKTDLRSFLCDIRVVESASDAYALPASLACDHTLKANTTYISFLKKFFRHFLPFLSNDRVRMRFFLYKRDFPDCAREIRIDDDASIQLSGFNAEHPTRILVHGWLTSSNGSFNRIIKNAYMNLAKMQPNGFTDSNEILSIESEINTNLAGDFNIIIVDWTAIGMNINYFSVVNMIDILGRNLAEFLLYLQFKANLHMLDVYMIGHSMGCHIAGSAGRQLRPQRIHTIFALDPAGPKFRNLNANQRLSESDAVYVEVIHTSDILGIQQDIGHASFYPNFGKGQKNCYKFGCSHGRAYHYFAESLTSELGFWGIKCEKISEHAWILYNEEEEVRMGGEPSMPKNGTFYVKTNDMPPYAVGRMKRTAY